jgi:hypothetical protein
VDHDKAQILSYVSSGFPPVLVLQSQDGGDGHAVCAVGVKLGDVSASTDPSIHFRDNATALRGVFIHDDRLGPYAVASLDAYTIPLGLPDAGEIRTRIIIKWPGEPVEDKEALLRAIIVPVPPKLRLTVARMRGLGFAMAQACTMLLPAYKDLVVLDCVYRLASAYRKTAYKFGLSKDGLYTLLSGIALSRYIGVIRLYCPSGPLMDLLVDATETQANPSVLACVKRHAWPNDELGKVNSLAKIVGACAIV